MKKDRQKETDRKRETKKDRQKERERPKEKEKERKRVSPRKQYPAGNQPADRIPPMRGLEDLSSQHAVVHVC